MGFDYLNMLHAAPTSEKQKKKAPDFSFHLHDTLPRLKEKVEESDQVHYSARGLS